MSKLQLNPSFHSQMAADENFSRAMTNVITEDMEVLMADEVEFSKSEMNWQRNVETFWAIFINSTIVTCVTEIKEENKKN
jgi:hypothetical protein